ncbi:MAG TPA: hypothetical protein DEQ43_09735 [Nocardioides bacterium]|nr:hypothetical protein [Nocardioides sp.]
MSTKTNIPAIDHKPAGAGPHRNQTPPTFTANGKTLTLIPVRDDWGCVCRDLGQFLEYADNGGRLVTKVTKDWANEMEENLDFLRGRDEPTDSVGSKITRAGGRAEVILTRSGINLVCLLSKKPLGKEIRRWLASDVMVKIADTGTYVAPNAEPQPQNPIMEQAFAVLASTLAESQKIANSILAKHESRLDTIERQLSQTAPDPSAEKRALEAEAKRREISEKRREAGRKGGLVTAERYSRDNHGRFAPKASAPPRPPTQTKIPLAPPLPAPSKIGPPGQVQIVQRKVDGEDELVRAARIASELRQPFYRYEFAIALWPNEPWNMKRTDMLLERLQGDGQVEPVARRTNGGATTTCFVYVGEASGKRVA